MLPRTWLGAVVLPVICVVIPLRAQDSAVWRDPSSHSVQFVTVDRDVRLEVLDWGGSGRPMIFLAGLGNTAHVFDDFAPKLTAGYHVYGITRRGFGASSTPASGYDADRLGDDVLAVLDSLKLTRPVLVGHSLAGEELSSIGSRHPERVAALVYLDAGYAYAFDNGKGMTMDQLLELQKKVPQPPEPSAADRASFAAFQAWDQRMNGIRFPEAELRDSFDSLPDGNVGKPRTPPTVSPAILAGVKKFTDIRASALAIYAVPKDLGPWLTKDPAARAAFQSFDGLTERQATAFEKTVPGARVVRLPNANHYVFISNQADVLREMRAFLATVK
ncbi:MAG: alpha/beta hydrolase [Bryobacteraceae bacterium]|jgi:pimeloyl-ACP methyl ester carboxylesterase